MKSSAYSQFCLRFFRPVLSKIKIGGLEEKNLMMEKADIGMFYEEYLAMAMMNSVIGACTALMLSIVFYILFPRFFNVILVVFFPLLAILIGWMAYGYFPKYMIKKRATDIERFLPYSVNFISTMSETGISPGEIFQTLSKTDIYGEIQNEAKKISKEINAMGVDNITALKHGLERTPSKKFKAFLQGMIGTIQSGSNLHNFLVSSVEKYMEEDLLVRKKNLEFLGLIAELFVMTVIAFPLFLVIIVAVMSFIGETSYNQFDIIFLLSLFILPLAYYGFYVLIKSTSIEEIGRGKGEPSLTLKEKYREHKSSMNILFISIGTILAFYVSIIVLQQLGYFELNFYNIFDISFLSILILIGPFGFHNYILSKKKDEIQAKLPDFLGSIGNSLSAGMSIFDAIKVSSKGKYGRLTPELKKMNAEISWHIPIKNVFFDFAVRMKNALIKRAIITINRGIEMGGNTPEIFKAAAKEIMQINNVREQRKTNMSMYTVVIIMCFFVFLFIMYILNNTLFTYFFNFQMHQTENLGSIVNPVDSQRLYYALYSFVFVQGIGSGVLGGYLLDGNLSSGVRYSFLLGTISIIVFKLLFRM